MGDGNLVIVFALTIVALLVLDLLILGRKAHKISMKEAGIWSAVFVIVSLLFSWYVRVDQGSVKATEFLSAYVIEKTLSVDNLFVFILIFNFFKVPSEYHHKVLFWGIAGAIVLRAIFIFTGVKVMGFADINFAGTHINLVLLAFGAFLIYAGIKAGKEAMDDDNVGDEEDFSNSPGARLIKKIFKGRVTNNYVGDKFVVRVPLTNATAPGTSIFGYAKAATPLLVVVGVVEFTDLLFAVDSIPAIFSVSNDPFILYSSNIFAILGLRSMYFLLAAMIDNPLFHYLNHGLAVILAFIGAKMVIAPFIHIDGNLSLFIVLGVLVLSVVISLIRHKHFINQGAE